MLILALLGDRMLDMAFYEKLIKAKEQSVAVATMRRSVMMSNSNLALFSFHLSPSFLTSEELDTMSVKERGTAVEAFLGATFELDNFQMTPRVRRVTEDILIKIETMSEAKHAEDTNKTTFNLSTETAKSALMNRLQKKWRHAKQLPFFTYESVLNYFPGQGEGMGWICKFELPPELALDKSDSWPVGATLSKPFPSKKIACDEVSKIVLNKLFIAEEEANKKTINEVKVVKSPK